ncbi:androgen-dependent TFPI-regulating protein-like [Schistocerca serialis cubense]|uniref:androgen-dependent TFPI-regulating protein-like n=1 Tax=Schistocerca serialis cubense TaxID=2023355 RepID=UPI00214DF10B|nr:androgen-dependent TFPI-regulating protein-like [Schistocerca serialis cubense]
MEHSHKMAGDKINTLRLIFHLGTVLHHALVIYYLADAVICVRKINNPWIQRLERFQGRFLTMWNFAMQAFYYTVCILQDTLELKSNNHLQHMNHYIRKLNSYIFQAFVFPLSPAISLVFWSIYLIDRELVFPKILDQCFSVWLNHGLHTVSSVSVFTEMFITSNWYTISRRKAVWGITASQVAYAICFFSTYYFDGVWLYPIFITSTWPLRISLVLLIYVWTLVTYTFGEYLSTRIWGHEIQMLKAQETSKKNKQI